MSVRDILNSAWDYLIKNPGAVTNLADEINDLIKKGDARLTRILLLNLKQFYDLCLFQTRMSFAFAIIAGSIGIVSFVIGAYFSIKEKDPNTIPLLGTALCSVVSGIGFYLYKESSHQFSYAFDKLDNLQEMLHKSRTSNEEESRTSNEEDINIR